MNFIFAQIFGIIALIFISISYFQKSKGKILLLNVIANAFYAIAFLFTNTLVAMCITFISISRCVFIYYAEKYSFKYKYHCIPLFICAYATVCIFLWTSALDLLPLLTSTIYTIGFSIQNIQTMRCVFVIPNAILIFYNIIVGTYTNALLDTMEIIILICSIIKFRKINNQNTEKITKNTN